MPLVRRVPKRGFNNKFALRIAVVNVEDLERQFSAGDEVDPETLDKTPLLGHRYDELKVLGNAVLAGVSNDVPSTSQIPSAYREALLAHSSALFDALRVSHGISHFYFINPERTAVLRLHDPDEPVRVESFMVNTQPRDEHRQHAKVAVLDAGDQG